MKRLMVFLVVCLMVSSSFAEVPAPVSSGGVSGVANNGSEQKKLISIDFPDTPLSTVLDVLSIKTGRKFVTDGELARKRIVMNLKDVSADEALEALLDTYNLYYTRPNEASSIYIIKVRPQAITTVTTVSKLIFLNFANAKSLEGVVKSKLSPSGAVVSEERTNSLIINDTADNLEKVESLIRELDTPTLQVLLEAKIIDVKLDSDDEFGVNINNLYRAGNYWASPLDVYRNTLFPGTLTANSYQPQVGYSQTLAPTVNNGANLSFSLLSGDYTVNGVIAAMRKDGNARLLTNPRLLVMNNNEATIDIVDQLVYEQETVSNGTQTFTPLFKDVGIKLKVKPQISRDGTIVLNIAPENSYQTGTAPDGTPIVNVSKSNTTFILRDGETAVIGGLIRETEQMTEFKVPLLGDIPLLGYLFKQHSKTKSRSELTIFITAKVMQ